MIFSPSLEMLYREPGMAFADKIRQAHALGFTAFEFWSWWDKDTDEIARLSRELGVRIASCCVQGVAMTDPAQRPTFLANLQAALQIAAKLDCAYMIVTTGSELPGIPREEQHAAIVSALRAGAPLAEQAGVTLVLEPLNTLVDHKGYYLQTTEEAVRIIDAVGSERVKLLFDVYHQQITEGNLIPNLTNYIDRIGYFHIADHPGRFEPGTGEINYSNVLAAIRKAGYAGYVGLEFRATDNPNAALSRFLAEYGTQASS